LAVISDARFSLSLRYTRTDRSDKVLSLSLDATNAEEEEGARFDERAPLSQSQKRVFWGKFRSIFFIFSPFFKKKEKQKMSRSIVSTTLAYTGGYIFLVLLAVCLATGAFFFFLFSVLEVASRARVYLRLASIDMCVRFGFFSLCRSLESFSFIDFERYR